MADESSELEELRQLVERAAAQDADAQRALIERYYERVRQMVHGELQRDFRRNHSWILPLFSTQDIVHEVFGGVIRNLDGCAFDSEDAFAGYLATVVRNRLLDAVRYHEAQRRDVRRRIEAPTQGMEALGGEGAEPAPELAVDLAERVGLLREVLVEFPLRQRTLLEMRMVDEQSFPVIAQKLGYASAESVRQSFFHAKAKLLVKLRARGIRGGDTLG